MGLNRTRLKVAAMMNHHPTKAVKVRNTVQVMKMIMKTRMKNKKVMINGKTKATQALMRTRINSNEKIIMKLIWLLRGFHFQMN